MYLPASSHEVGGALPTPNARHVAPPDLAGRWGHLTPARVSVGRPAEVMLRTCDGQKPPEKAETMRVATPWKNGVPALFLAFPGTLFASVFLLVATILPGIAVELVNPHTVLEETRRHMMEFDKRMQRSKAERQNDEKQLQARQKREEAERREREKTEKALAEAQRKRDAAEHQRRMREEKQQQARQKQEEAERQKREALQEIQRQRDAAEEQKRAREEAEREARHRQEEAEERERAKEAPQESQRQREAAAQTTRAQERGAASKHAQAEGEKTSEPPKQREGLRGMLSKRMDRRSACRQQAEERGLTGRKASRYTRLCVSGLPIPKTLSR